MSKQPTTVLKMGPERLSEMVRALHSAVWRLDTTVREMGKLINLAENPTHGDILEEAGTEAAGIAMNVLEELQNAMDEWEPPRDEVYGDAYLHFVDARRKSVGAML